MRGRNGLIIGVLVLAALGASGAWWRWGRSPTSMPPAVDLSKAEEEVRTLIEGARERVAREPGSAEEWGRLGKALLANGFDEEAMPVFARAAELAPDEPRWPYLQAQRLLLRNRAAGMELLRRAVDLADRADPDNTACRLLLAEVYFEQGDYVEVIELSRKVLEKEPNNARAHFHLGASLLQLDNLELSLRHLSRAAESPYARKRACVQLAALSLRMGNKAGAEQFARQARDLPPDLPAPDPYANEYRALAAGRQAKFLESERLEAQRRLGEGVHILREMADAFPDTRSQTALGTAMIKLGMNAAAEPVLREAVRQTPDSAAARYALCVSLYNQGEDLRRDKRPDEAQGKYLEAEKTVEQTLALKPDHALAHMYHGMACQRLGKRIEAIEAFRKGIRCRPEVSALHLHLGETLAETGATDEARKEIRVAIDLAAPGDPVPRQALERLR